MPSLAQGTNWTFQGRIINRATGVSIPATYRVTVSAADTQSTQFSFFNNSTQTLNAGLKQQALTVSVVRSGTGVTPNTSLYSGIFLNNTFATYGAAQYEGTATLRDASGNSLSLWIVTNQNVCSGRQQAKFQVNYSDSYSTITGFNCRN